MRSSLLILFQLLVIAGFSQRNCNVYPKDSPEYKACWLYEAGCEEPQGTKASQQYFDSAIAICPGFALAWYEKSVPYLKRGDFYTWDSLMQVAIKLEPAQYLGDRGWCRFKFLHDYKGALKDLLLSDSLRNGAPKHSGDDEYDLRILIALSYRETGEFDKALEWFGKSISDTRSNAKHGNYDYLHRAVTLYRLQRFEEALSDLEWAIQVYPQLAENYYYKSLILSKTGKRTQAIQLMEIAQQRYKQGYFHFDPYNNMIDRIYAEDIERALIELNK